MIPILRQLGIEEEMQWDRMKRNKRQNIQLLQREIDLLHKMQRLKAQDSEGSK